MQPKASPVFPVLYAGPIEYFALMMQYTSVVFERKEHFVKQSFRNRCEIVGANGMLKLSIPTIRKSRERTVYDEVMLAKEEQWNYIHWRSLCTAYRSSPYFEYYEQEIESFFLKPPDTLFEFNKGLTEWALKKLSLDLEMQYTGSFQSNYELDFRHRFSAKKAERYHYPRYIQVFEERVGFIPNLSVFDLLFNLGPESRSYLLEISKTIN